MYSQLKKILKKLKIPRNIVLGLLTLGMVISLGAPTVFADCNTSPPDPGCPGAPAAPATPVAPGTTAAAPAPAAAATGNTNEILKNLAEFINIAMTFLARFTWPVILMIGGLLNNDLLFSGGMEDMLLSIWSGVRDLVNILFVLSLIGVAVINIIGVEKEGYALKTIIPRIVIGLVLVNFSFLICKVSLDAVNVVSTGIFGLSPIQNAYQGNLGGQINKTAADFCAQLQEGAGKAVTASSALDKKGQVQVKDSYDKACADLKTNMPQILAYFSKYNANNAAVIMALNLQDVVSLKQVASGVSTLKDLTINSLFSVAFFIIYATAYIALFVSLIFRVVVLWTIIAVSPLLALGFAVPAVKARIEGSDETNLQKMFVEHALIPIPVAVVMSIGMAMISGIKSVKPTGTLNISTLSTGTLLSGMSNFQDIIVALGSVAFLWLALFTVLSKGKGKAVIDSIKGVVEGAGKTAASLPFYLPILPVKGGNVSLKGLSEIGRLPQQAMQEQLARDQRTLNITPSASDHLKALKSAKDERQAKDALKSIDLNNLNKTQKAELGEEIEKIAKEKKWNITVPNGLPFGSLGELGKQLKDDNVKPEDWNKVREHNGGIINDADIKTTDEATNSIRTGDNLRLNTQALKDAVKKFTEAKTAIDKAREKTPLLEAKTNLDMEIDTVTAVQSHVKEPNNVAAATALDNQLDKLRKHEGPEPAKRRLAIDKILRAAVVGDAKKQKEISDAFVSGNLISKPPSPTPPAATPPPPTPPVP